MSMQANYQFYHMYPLGMLDKLKADNDRDLSEIKTFIPHLKSMHINALYIGPLFQSVYHGYDTVDYRQVDTRLGNNDHLRDLVKDCHEAGIQVMLDCVFNHVSREHQAFQDLLIHKDNSKYRDWFNIDFSKDNHRHDGFSYEDWAGHDDLVKLNLSHEALRLYLIETALYWIDVFDIDGLRLDAADVMDRGFIRDLVNACRAKKAGFYVFGEMVHGDYQGIILETGMDGVTNYECYKGLYSSLNDKNYFEIAYSMNRLFSNDGLLKGKRVYNFVDNHDVDRVASTIENKAHLYPLYLMLYTMPGYPSIYYGSEFSMEGVRTKWEDGDLRKSFQSGDINTAHPLYQAIKKLSRIRAQEQTLAYGGYEEVSVNHQLIAYLRKSEERNILVIINSKDMPVSISHGQLAAWIEAYNLEGYDLLEEASIYQNLTCKDLVIYNDWGRILI